MGGGEDYDFATEFQAIYIAKQKPPPAPVDAEMGATVSSYPPLGQVTQLKTGKVTFTALLESEAKAASEPWQVAVWHSSDGLEWTETVLAPLKDAGSPVDLQIAPKSNTRSLFTASIPLTRLMHFTLKFRNAPDQPWRWARDEQGMNDGLVVFNPEVPIAQGTGSLSDNIKDLNPDLSVKSASSQSPGTQLWTIEAPVAAASADESGFATIRLGLPWGGPLRWFALVRLWSPWLAPRHGKTTFSLDKSALMCSFVGSEGKHLVILGISGHNNVETLFQSSESGQVLLNVRNDNDDPSTGLVLAAVGNSFESAMAACMYHARYVVLQAKTVSEELEKELQALKDDVKAEWYENWYDGLGYCTWNALGQRLTEEKIWKAVETLEENNINITSLIIDDNWQDIDYKGDSQFQYGWKGFEAEPKAFPKGLKNTISHIRSKYPNIQHIAVWHALLGYWGGISKEGQIAKDYKTVEVMREDAKRRNLPLGGPMTVVAKEDVSRFYNDFYQFLSSCGIDAVKTDAQFMIDMWTDPKTRRELVNEYLDAWTISTLRNFSIRAISCMSQTPHILYRAQMPRNRPALLVRNSDDFFPSIPSSHPWHLFTNAHNSLLTQHLNVLPDWDMFQTVHDYSGFHAAARCVSGGPIYITDTPGHHNIDLINQMTGLTPRGKTVIFRPSVLGRSLDQYSSYDDDALLRVGAYHGRAVTGTPIVGFFNISQKPLTEIFPLANFPGVLTSLSYIVRAHSTGLVSDVMQPGPSSLLQVKADVRGYDIFTAYAVTQFHSDKLGHVSTANLGLVGKMTGAAAIVVSDFDLLPNGRIFLDTKLKALGVLGIYISVLPQLSIEKDFMITVLDQPIPAHTVSIDEADKHVLKVDLQTAWKEMGLNSGWSNEVEAKVYFNVEE